MPRKIDVDDELLTLLHPFQHVDGEPRLRPEQASALLDYVEGIFASGEQASVSRNSWHEYLDLTGRPGFLASLASPEARNLCADHMFPIVDDTGCTLLKMFEQRVAEHPIRIEVTRVMNATTLDGAQ